MKFFYLFIIFSFLSACQTVSEKNNITKLTETLRTYKVNCRWGDLDKLVGYFKEPSEAEIQDDISNIKIVKYEVLGSSILTTETTAIQDIKIHYVYIDKQSLRTLIDHQKWHYDEEKSIWYRSNPLPQF